MNKNYYAVIMAGGVGSRFWPLSRRKNPKQFIDILGTGKTLFQATYERLARVCRLENIYIVANESYRDIIQEQIPGIDNDHILGEPHPRNTAPCVAYASFKIAKIDPDAVIAVIPSDHLIGEEELFKKNILNAFKYCEKHDHLLTMGISPTRADTGYGYIQMDEDEQENGIYKIKTFTEKPNSELAEYFVKSGEFLWNSGMFIWKVSTILNEFQRHLPEMYETFDKGRKAYFEAEEREFIQKAYELCTIISIDYGIMEKARNVYVLPASFQWSDIGTWNALHHYSRKDENGNTISGDMVFLRNTGNCIINMPDKKLVALNNVSNLIVCEADGILLIADLNKEQEIRQVVNDIKIQYGEKYI